MKATKIFIMAALALTFAACSNNDDNDFAQQPAEQPANGEITITATLDANDGASTRALSIDGSNIASTWKTTDEFAILYNNGTDNTKSIATVDKIDGTTVTITFTIPATLANNTDCKIVYPASAANAANTGADVATALATQDGTIGNCPEVRVGTATINKDNHSLSNVTKLAAQNAIFKLTLKDIDGTNNVSATSVVISDQTGVVTTVTPASGYEKAMYVALPITATTLKFQVTGSDSKKYFNMASSLSLDASYYQSTVKLATVGDVILSTGKCAKAGTSGAVAKIAYLGNDAETSTTYNHGLALALNDVSGTTKAWCSQTGVTCLGNQYDYGKKLNDLAGIANTDALVNHTGHTHAAASAARGYNSGTHPAGTSAWFLPSAGQWDKMTGATGLGLSNMGLQYNVYYWSSTEYNASLAWRIWSEIYNDGVSWGNPFKNEPNKNFVRACLAF